MPSWLAGPGYAPDPASTSLPDGNRRADTLENGLRLLGGLLVDLLKNPLRSAVDEILGLLQAQARQRPDLLDHLDLLVAGGLEDDIELVLLLRLRGGLAATAGRARRRNGDRGGGLDVKGLLELLHELRQFDERHLLERVKQVRCADLRHLGASSV